MQRLARIDVAEAGDDMLIEQRQLQRRALPGAGTSERGAVEVRSERLRSHRIERRILRQLPARHQVHDTEPARIVERDRRTRRHAEHDVVMAIGRIAAFLRAGVAVDAHRARHPQVHHQRLAGRELCQQELAAAPQRPDGAPLEPAGEVVGKRPSQSVAAKDHAAEARTLHDRLQAAANGFDFG